jgi:protein archease
MSETIQPRLFREIEHTGDIGIELEADSRAELFRRAAIAIAQLMVDTTEVRAQTTRDLLIAGSQDEDLMHDMLSALLQLFLLEAFIWSAASIEERDDGLKLQLSGEPFNPDRHQFYEEIKAVTYHQLSVRRTGGKWRARVIFDV